MADKENVVILTDDEGKEVEFEHIDTIEMNDECYVLLLPVEEPDDGVVILKFETDDEGDEILVGVDNDEEAMLLLLKGKAVHNMVGAKLLKRELAVRIKFPQGCIHEDDFVIPW